MNSRLLKRLEHAECEAKKHHIEIEEKQMLIYFEQASVEELRAIVDDRMSNEEIQKRIKQANGIKD